MLFSIVDLHPINHPPAQLGSQFTLLFVNI